jgi:uncharacterized protein (DUF885 family)
MSSRRIALLLVTATFLTACGRSQPAPTRQPADAKVRALADAVLAGYFERYPEEATSYGVPGHRHDRLTDNSLAGLQAWQAREDGWMRELSAIDAGAIENPRLRATHAIVRQFLEGDTATRVCRSELWNVNQQTGWAVELGYIVTIQPVGSPEARADALARWSTLPKYIDTEIANLREGIKLGYTAPKQNVRIVIDQVRALASSPVIRRFIRRRSGTRRRNSRSRWMRW